MRVYFAPVNETELEDFGADGLLEHKDEFYNYMVEFGTNPGGTDDIMLHDGCGRRFPVSVEHLAQLQTALVEIAAVSQEIQAGKQLEAYIMDSDTVATMCEYGHLHY